MITIQWLFHSVHIGFPKKAVELSGWQTQRLMWFKGKRIGFGVNF